MAFYILESVWENYATPWSLYKWKIPAFLFWKVTANQLGSLMIVLIDTDHWTPQRHASMAERTHSPIFDCSWQLQSLLLWRSGLFCNSKEKQVENDFVFPNRAHKNCQFQSKRVELKRTDELVQVAFKNI